MALTIPGAPGLPLTGGTLTGGIGFSVTNTVDIGTSATVLAPRTVYAGTSIVTPVVTATASVAIGGATIGTDALGITGTVSISGNTTLGSSAQLLWSTDLILGRAGAANLRLGAVDAAAPVAQTISVQNVVTATSNTVGAALTIKGSQGTGTGVGGSVIIQTAPAGSTGSTPNALATALTVYGSGDVGIGTGSAIATTATSGFLLIPTCAGTPTGAPPNAGTGKAALIFDTSASQLWISVSGASWKQPKTPAAAALITWQ